MSCKSHCTSNHILLKFTFPERPIPPETPWFISRNRKRFPWEIYFLSRSSPAMDYGSVETWIHALDHVLEFPLENVVPGHFELATKSELKRFRDYLNDLYEQVRALKQKNETIEQVRHDIHMEKYSDFRQYAKYEATFGDNAAVIYQQIKGH